MSTAKLGLCLIAVSLMACTESDTLGKVTHLDAGADEDASTPALRYWVGTVEDSDIRLGVAQEPERARVFFCGGPSSYATATRWVVTMRLPDWRWEMLWMSLYFSFGVWISVSLIRAPYPPAIVARGAAAPQPAPTP